MSAPVRILQAAMPLLVACALAPALAGADATPAANAPDTFPWDFTFDIPQPGPARTYRSATLVAHSDSPWVRADLEDFELVAAQYRVHVVMKPPACDSPADWHDGGWSLPDWTDALAPLDWDARCQPAGLWTIEVEAEAEALSVGTLRVHLSEIAAP